MNILVAVDFSAATESILHSARDWALRPGTESAHIYLLHVTEPDPAFVGWEGGPDVVRDQMAHVFQREHRELGELAVALREAGVEAVTPLLVQGATVKTILDQAERLEASLVVVGSHGRGATYDLLIGSVSSGVIRGSRVPVLVIPVAAGR
jgi:nucleotide-binding universal stress UspA family protein